MMFYCMVFWNLFAKKLTRGCEYRIVIIPEHRPALQPSPVAVGMHFLVMKI